MKTENMKTTDMQPKNFVNEICPLHSLRRAARQKNFLSPRAQFPPKGGTARGGKGKRKIYQY